MTKLIWMSDLHFCHEGDVLGHDPRARLTAAIDHINTLHRDAAYCVITGDMVDRGTPENYRALAALLDSLAIPCLPMTGNHDTRALFRQAFTLPETVMDSFVQYTRQTPDGLLVCLDTLIPDADSGELCPARMQWLQEILDGAKGQPLYLFMHHPPHALELPMQDADNLRNGEAFLDLVTGHDCVKYLFLGHVHRPVSGTVRGLPFSTMRSTLYQAPAPRPAWSWDTFMPAAEAPNIGIISIKRDNGVTIQYETF